MKHHKWAYEFFEQAVSAEALVASGMSADDVLYARRLTINGQQGKPEIVAPRDVQRNGEMVRVTFAVPRPEELPPPDCSGKPEWTEIKEWYSPDCNAVACWSGAYVPPIIAALFDAIDEYVGHQQVHIAYGYADAAKDMRCHWGDIVPVVRAGVPIQLNDVGQHGHVHYWYAQLRNGEWHIFVRPFNGYFPCHLCEGNGSSPFDGLGNIEGLQAKARRGEHVDLAMLESGGISLTAQGNPLV